jgi:hypothetical protein
MCSVFLIQSLWYCGLDSPLDPSQPEHQNVLFSPHTIPEILWVRRSLRSLLTRISTRALYSSHNPSDLSLQSHILSRFFLPLPYAILMLNVIFWQTFAVSLTSLRYKMPKSHQTFLLHSIWNVTPNWLSKNHMTFLWLRPHTHATVILSVLNKHCLSSTFTGYVSPP